MTVAPFFTGTIVTVSPIALAVATVSSNDPTSMAKAPEASKYLRTFKVTAQPSTLSLCAGITPVAVGPSVLCA